MATSIIKAVRDWATKCVKIASTAILNMPNSHRPHIKVNIDGLASQMALLDSGSGVSCVNAKLVSSLRSRKPLRPANVTLIDAQENVLQCSGIGEFRIRGY